MLKGNRKTPRTNNLLTIRICSTVIIGAPPRHLHRLACGIGKPDRWSPRVSESIIDTDQQTYILRIIAVVNTIPELTTPCST